jgi:hypothetical protein
LSAAYLIAEESRGTHGTANASDVPAIQDTLAAEDGKNLSDAKDPDRKVIAYYFHGDFRCATCRKIEAYSEEAIKTGFPEELKSGELEWRVVNVDESDNKHFEKEYELYTRSLVLVEIEDDKQKKWDNLEKVWEFVHNKKAFTQYVVDNTRAYLDGDDD